MRAALRTRRPRLPGPALLGRAALCLVLTMALGIRAAHAQDADTARAREYFKEGVTAYDLGKYDEAIVAFEQAYRAKDDPVFLYNIAQSHRLAQRFPEAVRFYKNYLRRAPHAGRVGEE